MWWLWIVILIGLVTFFGLIRYFLRRSERDGTFERKKTEKGVSFNWPGGGPG